MGQLIISIGREFGSGGHEIAEKLAKHYDMPLYDHNLLDKIAEERNLNSEELKSYDEVIEMFEEKTKRYKYFRLLISGKKYYIGDVCFIGDTGWTSFKRNGERVDLEYFDNLPEVKEVRNFSCIDIIERHNKWIEFANNIIATEKKLLFCHIFP